MSAAGPVRPHTETVPALLDIELTAGPLPVVVATLGAAALLCLLVSRQWRRWLPWAAAAFGGGVLLGLALCWLLGDVLDLFDVVLSSATRFWFAVAVGGLVLAVARIVFSGRRLVAVGSVAILLVALMGAVGINADLGEFPTVRSALGLERYPTLALPHPVTVLPPTRWVPPAGMPSRGREGLVTIPATTSGFPARQAMVYLPPAALEPVAARLPVLVLLSGQPGAPQDLFSKGRLNTILDDYAVAHRGLAPVVVVPDQLSAPQRNPMCVDSPLGNSASYLTVDVPRWIRSHLTVEHDPAGWGIGGFSQGGTCAIQLGAAHPGLFGTIIDISGQVAPISGSLRNTIETAFGGSPDAYRAATPAALMAVGAPYHDVLALFLVGADDLRYRPGVEELERDADAAGMTTRLILSPGTAHDWHTVQYAESRAIPIVARGWGLDG